MPPSINADTLRRHVPAITFQRGQALWRTGCVSGPGIEPLGERRWHLFGEVQGSMSQPYETGALVETAADGAILRFEGDCSCPVGLDCKHAVALTLQLAQQHLGERTAPQSVAAARLARWLDRCDAGAGVALASSDLPVYLLSEAPRQADAAAWLQLSWAVSRPLKLGGWAKPRVPGYGAEYRLASLQAGAAGDDLECVQLIRALGRAPYGYASAAGGALSGRAGPLALQLCAGTGRLFMADGRGAITGDALRWGAARTLGWQWQPAGAGLWALQPRLPESAAQAYAGPPALYVDPQAGECGPLLAPGIEPQRLAALFEMPPVPAAAFVDAGPRLLTRLAGLPLPPSIEAPSNWPATRPAPRLALSLRPRPERESRGLLVARLSFDYGGPCGHWPDAEVVKLVAHEGRRVLLSRDLAAEAAAHAALAGLGLSPEPAPAYRAGTRQWLDWAEQDWRPLREAGFEIEAAPAPDELMHTAGQVVIRLDEQGVDDDGAAPSWFDLSLGLEIDGVRHNVLPWLPGLLAQLQPGADGPTLPEWLWTELPDGRWLRLPSAPLRPWLAALLELVGEHKLDADSLRLSHIEALRLGASLGEGARWDGAERLRSLLGELAGGELPQIAPPAGLAAELRPYQRRGLDWLQFLRAQGLGGVLADDMGLGKTLQTLAHLLCEQQAGRLDAPCLVVAPVSLLGNWRREAARFAPALRTRVWHGGGRHDGGFAEDCDLLIAPYSLLQRDRERWLAQRWHVVVLDEAQHVKNASTQAAQVASALQARQRIALSGTPLENHLGELWSLFHFLMPGFLGSQARFKTLFRTPIEKQGQAEPLQRLGRRVTPFMLRRTREAVAAELPPRIESTLPVTLEGAQADLYETIRLATEKTVREALAARGLARSQIQVLDALLKLRQACCDPRLVKGVPAAAKARASAKLVLLMELLAELLAEGRRVLVFSQFTSMLTLIEAELAAAGLSWTKLTGQTQKRDTVIERFTSGAVPLFLISLKAGGTGLNLPQADVVIHYDPWWNPAVEAQATGRAHRIGQTRQVLVYRLVAEGTIEERMLALQARKAALAQGLLEGAVAREQPLFTEDDLAELLRPLGDRGG
ncbi:DEAD/DEAH box helicase [Roseateles saccharophilus]|uniref:SNF2 family DNA or RNA helicase n=2 Tax=Roseateles saccharophilus TaxID=304 RepID=A0A4R3UQK5_ROSSA|nr:DEAD/DEAH box helicase [Roseateles saccharophilus]MDG0834706.1 helicase SNF2 [Roseateles saccharophilus]TCU92638.1 SNF2 family DNA or RNA helicase [Roseateles saccharophilus]